MARPQTRKRRRTTTSKSGSSKRLAIDVQDLTSTLAIARPVDNAGYSDSPITRLPAELLAHILSFILVKHDGPVKLYNAKSRRWRNEQAKLAIGRPCICGTRGFCSWPHMHQNHGSPDGRKIKPSSRLNLLLVCRTLYFAGIETYHENNTFEFQAGLDFMAFLNQTGTDRRRYVKSVKISMEWMRVTRWDEARQEMLSRYTCDLDEPALRSDLLESIPVVKDVTINVSPKYISCIQDPYAVEDIRKRMMAAWPSEREKIGVYLDD